MAGVSLRACNISRESFSPSGISVLILLISSFVFTDSSYNIIPVITNNVFYLFVWSLMDMFYTLMVAWSVNSSSCTHSNSLMAMSLWSLVKLNTSAKKINIIATLYVRYALPFASGAIDIDPAVTGEGERGRRQM